LDPENQEVKQGHLGSMDLVAEAASPMAANKICQGGFLMLMLPLPLPLLLRAAIDFHIITLALETAGSQ